jgi:UDP-4-amino-4,6-dideoxy-N-acetyl-beta-L-altrosamine transaminase
MNTIPYGRQNITQEDIDSVVDVLKSDFLTQGPAVEKFEAMFCEFIGCKYAVAVTNGTAALHLAAMALGVKPGDKVLCTTNSFVASANCVLYCGGDIEFVDINNSNFCMDLNLLEEKIKAAPKGSYKGIIAVDFAGYPMNFEALSKIAKAHGLWVIEDACHALGATFKDSKGVIQKSGNGVFADIAVSSFHPVKHIATGEGGMIATNDLELYNKLKLIRTHGITKDPKAMSQVDGGWYYEMQELGFNYRISDILCTLGASQLKRIESNLKRRREIARKYSEELKGIVGIPQVEEGLDHAYHLYVIQTEKRKELYEFLKSKGVYPQVHYIPIHTQPFYVEKYGKQTFKAAESYYSKALSIPMYHSLTDEDQQVVIKSIKEFIK